mgnify:CR=1 FL=1
MRRFSSVCSAFAAIVFMILTIAGHTDAQRRNEREVRDVVRSLTSKIDDFQYGLRYQLESSSADPQIIVDADESIDNLQDKVIVFEENFTRRREVQEDVRNIVTAAQDVEGFLIQNRQNQRIQNNWNEVKGLVDRLASNYDTTPNWTGRVSAVPPPSRTENQQSRRQDPPTLNQDHDPKPTAGPVNPGLTGTYQLDTARSEQIADIISQTGVSGARQQDLQSKLEAPEQIALDIRGDQVTLASSKATPVTFIADGREKTENSGGRTVRVRATIRGEELTLSSLGGETDYTVTFTPVDDGLKVTRRITTDYLNETVFAESFYTKRDSVARIGIDTSSTVDSTDDTGYSSSDPNDRPGSNSPNPTISNGRVGQFIVPDGTIIEGILDNMIDTKVSQNNDRFKLTVQSPNQFRGATIEGYISGVGQSGRVSGRSNITFNFQSITLRNGERYDFAGSLQSIRDEKGKDVRVDEEGVAKGDSQTRETVKRGGIGAGLGAIIGAIAGGGKGAAIGAIIGGGAGAGSVIVQGRDDLQLMQGSTITIQASSPIRREPAPSK